MSSLKITFSSIGFFAFACWASSELRVGAIEIFYAVLGVMREWPATFWGTVAGSIFTLIGVGATNYYTDRRTQRAHDHEVKQKKLEREMTLRREVYLAAAEAISHGMQMLPHFANPLMTDHDITKDFFNKSSAIAKVQVVSGVSVSAAILKLMRALNDAILDIGPHRAQLLRAQAALTDCEKTKDARRHGRENMAEQMLEGVRSGAIKSVSNDPHSQLLAIFDEAIEQETKKVEAARDQVRIMTYQTFTTALNGLNVVASLLPETYLAVREELSLDIDSQTFKTILDEHSRLSAQRISEALHKTPNDSSETE